jgi:hypothetical protein
MSRTFFSLRRRRGFGSRHPAPLTVEDARAGLCSGVFHLGSCIFISSDDANRVLKLASRVVVRCGNQGSICGSWPSAFSGCPKGHRDFTEAKVPSHLYAYRPLGCSPSNPSVSRTNRPPPEKESAAMERALTRDAQAACDFSFSASKFSPFFHRVNVMAASLRASVSRTMVGLMPLASDRW